MGRQSRKRHHLGRTRSRPAGASEVRRSDRIDAPVAGDTIGGTRDRRYHLARPGDCRQCGGDEPMATAREHLGPFSDLVEAAGAARPLFRAAATTGETRQRAREVLRFSVGDERPIDARSERRWQEDGVDGEEVSWSVGFGPRTRAWLLRPAGVERHLPGIVALFDHGHFKYCGKEKIADGPDGPLPVAQAFRDTYYSGRGFANRLARSGFAVLVHDVFLFGSRRFPVEAMPAADRDLAEAVARTLQLSPENPDVGRYHGAAYLHENLIEKYCTLLGTNLAAVIGYEDRVALNYLRGRRE